MVKETILNNPGIFSILAGISLAYLINPGDRNIWSMNPLGRDFRVMIWSFLLFYTLLMGHLLWFGFFFVLIILEYFAVIENAVGF